MALGNGLCHGLLACCVAGDWRLTKIPRFTIQTPFKPQGSSCRYTTVLLIVAWLAGSVCVARAREAADTKLWYRQPAAKWEEALPVGNGRLGAMVFGAVATEQIQLNENTIWSGGDAWPI